VKDRLVAKKGNGYRGRGREGEKRMENYGANRLGKELDTVESGA